MAGFSPFSPVDIRILSRASGLEALKGLLEDSDGFAVLASEAMLDKLVLHSFMKDLLAGGKGTLYAQSPANPSVSDVFHALDALKGRRLDRLVAIGGGSSIDLAKAVSALYGLFPEGTLSQDTVLEAILRRDYAHPHAFIPVIALPTTAGTGSEVTKWATVWDPEHDRKLSIDCPELFPRAALILPEFTLSMRPALTLATGLDALSHAMEAYWARSRTPLSQALALAAMERVRDFLPRALSGGAEDLPMREEMCLGALLAGLAFSITRTTACHSISYPLTLLYGIPHGLAAAMTLASVMAHNESAVPEISKIRGLFEGEGGLPAFLDRLSGPIRPLRLSAWGVKDSDLPGIAELTFTAGRMDNNPVLFSREEVLDILQECL